MKYLFLIILNTILIIDDALYNVAVYYNTIYDSAADNEAI
jgi:hypothetical protein